MQKKACKKQYSDYEQSIVAKNIHHFLASLDLIQRKYTIRSHGQSVEEVHALSQIQAIKEYLINSNQFLKKFSKGAKPGITDFVDFGHTLYKLNHLEKPFRLKRYAFYCAIEKALPDIVKTILRDLKKATFFGSTNDSLSEEEFENLKSQILQKLEAISAELLSETKYIPGQPDDQQLLDKLRHTMHQIDFKNYIRVPNKHEVLTELFDQAFQFGLGVDKITHSYVIGHPMSFELTAILIQMLQELPLNCADLLTFFNPESLVMDFTGGVSGLLVKAFVEGGFKVERANLIGQDNEFDYVLRIGGLSYTINTQNYYRIYKQYTQNFLLTELQHYFDQYEDTTHVKSEKAKGVVYSKFLVDEKKRFDSLFSRYDYLSVFTKLMTPVTDLASLKTRISYLKESLEQSDHIQAMLKLRKAELDTATLLQLCEPDETYRLQLAQDSTNKLDVSYWHQTLPNVFVGCSYDKTAVGVIPVKAALHQQIKEYCSRLAKERGGLLSELNALEANRKELVAQQIDEDLHNVTMKCNSMSDKITAWTEALRGLQQKLNESLSGLNIEQLTHLTQQYNQVLTDIKAIDTGSTSLLEALSKEKLVSCSEFTTEEIMLYQSKSQKIFDPVESDLVKLTERSHLAIQYVESKLAALKAQLQKVEEHEFFSSNIRKSGLGDITNLIETLNDQLQASLGEVSRQELSKEAQQQIIAELNAEKIHFSSELQKFYEEQQTKELSFVSRTKVLNAELANDCEVTFSTLEQSISAALFKATVLIQSQQNNTSLQQIQDCETKLKALKVVQEFLNSSKDENISLAGLSALKELNSKLNKNQGFTYLLDILGQLAFAKQWDVYFKNQKQYTSKVKTEKWLELHDLILDKVEHYAKIKTTLIKECELSQKHHSVKEQLILLSNELQNFNNDILKNQEEALALRRKLESVNSRLDEHKNLELERENTITLSKDQIQATQKSINFLNDINELKEKLNALLLNIGNAEENIKDLNLKFISFVICELSQELKTGEEQLLSLESMSQIVGVEYRPMIEQLGTFNKIIGNRIQNLIHNTFGQELVSKEHLLNSMKTRLMLLKEDILAINISMSLDEKVQSLLKSNEKLLELKKEQEVVNNELVDTHTGIKLIKNPQLDTQYVTVINLYKTIEATIEKTQGTFEKCIVELLADLTQNVLKPINASALSREYLRELDARLERVKSDLNGLRQLGLKPSDYVSVNLAIDALKQKQLLISHHVLEREQLVTEFKKQITSYLTKRNLKYQYKDILFSADKWKRIELLNTLTRALDEYVNSGDIVYLVSMLTEAKTNYPGIQLRALLNKILVGIKDTDSMRFKNKDESEAEFLINKETQSITVLLDRLRQKNPLYVDQILLIKQKLKCLKDYGLKFKDSDSSLFTEILNFKSRLNKQLNQFIRLHAINPPTQIELKVFQEDFIMRLHAYDDVMSAHRHAWKPIIANIVIAILSLGIAPAIQLTYSKLNRGTCSLFFAKTHREKLLHEISDSVENMAQAASAA